MSPEGQLIAINVVFLGYAYFWAYPRLATQSGLGIMWRDAVLMVAALMVGAFFFAGKGVGFGVAVFETNWFVYQLIAFAVIETLLFVWYAWKNDLEF